jgi:hypothetical protein
MIGKLPRWCFLLAGWFVFVPGSWVWAGDDFLGEDALWRAREEVVFHLVDAAGAGFGVDVAVRDMNVYAQGRRPALIWMVGPGGETVFRRVLADDGVTGGNEQYRDGISDVYMDYRYREWHRAYSPGGRPAGKSRSPYLKHPERLPARHVSFEVCDGGRGLYRLVLIGSWDHWFSVSVDRDLPVGVHPGPGPLYVHGDRLKDAYVYAPEGTQEVLISVSEEVRTFNWQAVLETASGEVLGRTTPRNFLNYCIEPIPQTDAVYRLRVTGETPGACLAVKGLPFVVCPDPASARAIHGGMAVDGAGRWTFHPMQRRLLRWVEGLSAEDLAVAVSPPDPETIADAGLRDLLEKVAEGLGAQNTDPESPDFGRGAIPKVNMPGRRPSAFARAAAWDHPENPYYGSGALVRRVLLSRAVGVLQNLNPYFWFARTANERPGRWQAPEDRILGLVRSQWFAMHGGRHVDDLLELKSVAPRVLPKNVLAAWKRMYECWAEARTLMHQGLCSNQWAASMAEVAKVWDAVDSPVTAKVLARQVERFTTPGGQGRVAPDPTPYSIRSRTAFSYAADVGVVGAGFAAEALGHDNEYCQETTWHLNNIWNRCRHPALVDYLNDYYRLKTHLTLPKTGRFPERPFRDTCSPTDMNSRTRYYSHRSPLSPGLRARIRYGHIWAGRRAADLTWPCLEPGEFTRVIDNRFFFIKTPAYYAIACGDAGVCDFQNFTVAEVGGGSARLVGYGRAHYGVLQRKAPKPGGISAVFVKDCGPTLLAQNHNVMYANGVWGRRTDPVCGGWEEDWVDPYIVCSGFSHPDVQFDREGRVMRRVERLRHAPLTVTRTLHYKDDRIDVTLELLATDDLDLRELYECVPYVAEGRVVRILNEDLQEIQGFRVPQAVTSQDTHALPLPRERGEDSGLPEVVFRAVDISGESGAGATVVFEREARFKQTRPLRYRPAALATGAFNLPLPTDLRAGQRHVVRYGIIVHGDLRGDVGMERWKDSLRLGVFARG